MRTGIAVASIVASLLALPVFAQPAQGTGGGMGPGMAGGQKPRDCSQARNPEACTAHQEARRKAHEACKDRRGAERRACYHEQMQTIDCVKSGNPQQCEARKQVYAACKGEQSRRGFKQCVQQKMPPADCARSQNPMLCDQHNRAREACKDKLGQEHRACLREHLAPSR